VVVAALPSPFFFRPDPALPLPDPACGCGGGGGGQRRGVVVAAALPSPFFFPGQSSAALVSQFSCNAACVVPLTGWQIAAIE